MPLPPISELEFAAKKLVWSAKKKGSLKEYTPRLIREILEKEYELEEGILGQAEYKSTIKAATKAALSEQPPISEDEQTPHTSQKEPSPSGKKRKSDAVKSGHTKKMKTSPTKKLESGVKAESAGEGLGGTTKKKRNTTHKKIIAPDKGVDNDFSPNPRLNDIKIQKEEKIKSSEHVPTSDIEQFLTDPRSGQVDKPSTSKAALSDGTAGVHSDKLESQDTTDPKKEDGTKSESELSVLDDEPPKQKRRSKSGEKEAKRINKSKPKKESSALSKDEETIKRLKSLVVACGVRKVWSKVFQGINTPQQQIRKLKEILGELGMTGRMSMEQAKAVKQKRELAQELEEVQAFAKAIEAQDPGDSQKSDKMSGSEEEKADSDDSDALPKKRLMNARKSITAFLQDQSSDEE